MYEIKPWRYEWPYGLSNRYAAVLTDLLTVCFAHSRFTAKLCEGPRPANQQQLVNFQVREIRLREKAPYYGSTPDSGHYIGSSRFLTGVDWIAVSDLINDALDFQFIGAEVSSRALHIRRRAERRISYNREARDTGFRWVKYGSYSEYKACNGTVAPRSSYPAGLPGSSRWAEFRGELCPACMGTGIVARLPTCRNIPADYRRASSLRYLALEVAVCLACLRFPAIGAAVRTGMVTDLTTHNCREHGGSHHTCILSSYAKLWLPELVAGGVATDAWQEPLAAVS